MKKLKINGLIAIIFIILLAAHSYAQTQAKDTFNLKIRDLRICFEEMETLTRSGGKYFYNRIEVDSISYEKMYQFSSTICDSLFLKEAVGKYCKFYNKDSIIVLESIWYPEFYAGPYKEYYDNGTPKVFGQFVIDGEGYELGTRKGKWIYYYPNGKIKKIKNYTLGAKNRSTADE